jgi:hypothetical protein
MSKFYHRLVCGATRSGKSEHELGYVVRRVKRRECAVVAYDAHGTFTMKLAMRLAAEGARSRVLYDRLSDTDRTLGYEFLAVSNNPDELQRAQENDERKQSFKETLLSERGMMDDSASPIIREGLDAALDLYFAQDRRAPIRWLARVFREGPEQSDFLRHCTDPGVLARFEYYNTLSPSQWEYKCGPATRILKNFCECPSVYVRDGASFDLAEFLNNYGVLILDGSSRGNLSRYAGGTMMRALSHSVLMLARSGKLRVPVLNVYDEAVNSALVTPQLSRGLAEGGKWDWWCDIIVQQAVFPTEEIEENVMQNMMHYWFRQGSPKAAQFAAEDVASRLYDPLRVKFVEFHKRQVHDGYEYEEVTSSGVQLDGKGKTKGKSSNTNVVARAKYREEVEERPRHFTPQEWTAKVAQKITTLGPGYCFIAGVSATEEPEYMPMERELWSGLSLRNGMTLAEKKFLDLLDAIKRRPEYRVPVVQLPPVPPPPPSSPATPKAGSVMRRS